MANVIDKIMKVGTKIYSTFNGLSQAEIDRKNSPKVITEGMPEILRYAASQGAVLLENDGTLPLKKGSRVALFGRVQKDWFYTGYGSGGDVNKPYAVNLIDGVKNCEELELNEALAEHYENWCEQNPVDHGVWGQWPRFYPDMPLSDEVVCLDKRDGDTAIVIIGRSSGEDRENALEKGSYYITDEELAMLDKVTAHFEKAVVLLNIGCLMDLTWIEKYEGKISAVLLVWQGGMESGNAVCDLLSGKVNPSGKLPSTVARSYKAYPGSEHFGAKNHNCYIEDIYVGYRYFETFCKNEVKYPFGYGLSYTAFEIGKTSFKENGDKILFSCEVKNTGDKAGREVVQVYVEKPCGKLGNPVKELAFFKKTKLLEKGESQKIEGEITLRDFASYDDRELTPYPFSYVIEKGVYGICVGNSVRDTKTVFTKEFTEDVLVEKLSQCSAPQESFTVMTAVKNGEAYEIKREDVTKRKYSLKKIIIENLPADIPMTGDKGIKLTDVKNGKKSMEEFVAQLSLKELEAITRGAYVMGCDLGVSGNAGCFAGVLESLRNKGVPAVTTTDGPSGIRLSACCSLIPIGTLLASSFDTDLVEELYTAVGDEMAIKQSDVLLAPGMNIHRNPLCGRNFEYYSEDPVVTGKIAAAAVRGIQKHGRSACPKHFACNNQEFNRAGNDSRLSERALRQIYLRGFEICVKEGNPHNIMTSYNLINGVWGHYNYELVTRILRGEWGYNGNVMTDWWMKKSKSQEFPQMCDQAYRVRAGVDLLMPGGERVVIFKKPDGTLLKTYGKKDGITLGEMQRCAMNILNFAMNSTAMERMN
ncbi:MAG: glycoside hydrolase family 3 C-terminal domain-containing protein [Acutalibacteraceae bacterium]